MAETIAARRHARLQPGHALARARRQHAMAGVMIQRPPGDTASWLARRWPWVGVGARLMLGVVWVVAGVIKLPDPAESVRAVRAYRLLPEAMVPVVGYGLPVLEVSIGVLLVVGAFVRFSAVVSAVLLAGFLVGIGSAWARALEIDCGCFGGGGQVAATETRYPQEVARDTALLVVALALAMWPRTRLSLSSAPHQPDPTHDQWDPHPPGSGRTK